MSKPVPMTEGEKADLDFLADDFQVGLRPGEFTISDARERYNVSHKVTLRILERLRAEGKVTRRRATLGRVCWAYTEVKK